MKKLFNFSSLWIYALLVLIAGLFMPSLMGNDANEYASIALRMYRDHDYINIINRDYDYLDKPHILFWSAAVGYNLFGIYHWSYRIISVLVCLVGAYSTFRLGKVLYNHAVGEMGSLIFISAYAIQLGNHDVRTDALLTGFVILSIWQFVEFIENQKLKNILLAAAALALAVGTKGMVAVLVTGCCIFFYLLSKKKWKTLLNWKWGAGIVTFILVLSPVLYCYYQQFDIHPEKHINGATGVSGIKFLLWTQSFERLAANHPRGTDNPEFFFLYHSFLWSFLPWTFLALGAFFDRAKGFYKWGVEALLNKEQLTFLGTFVMFNMMSISKFKLPHYTNILFPMIAIATAAFVYDQVERNTVFWKKYFKGSQALILLFLVVAGIALNTWFFPAPPWMMVVGFIFVFFIYLSYRHRYNQAHEKFWVPLLITILAINFFMNVNFYPQLSAYQAGSEMAKKIHRGKISWDQVYIFEDIFRSFDFYSGRINPQITIDQLKSKAGTGEKFYVFVTESGKEMIASHGIIFKEYFSTPDVNITKLKLKFLNPATRSATLNYAYLLEMN